jgi:hypothetical protein
MSIKIQHGEQLRKRIADRSPMRSRIDPMTLARALGAEPVGGLIEAALAPLTLSAVRKELYQRIASGQESSKPGPIELPEADWTELEKLALAIAEPGLAPTSLQVAKVLLNLSVRSMASQVAGQSLLAHELAVHSATVPG